MLYGVKGKNQNKTKTETKKHDLYLRIIMIIQEKTTPDFVPHLWYPCVHLCVCSKFLE